MQVRVFSRNCEDVTAQMPDVVQQVLAAAEGESSVCCSWLCAARLCVPPAPNAARQPSNPPTPPPPMLCLPLRAGGAATAILDAEIVKIDRATGRLGAFQELASRARAGVELGAITGQSGWPGRRGAA